LNVSGLWIMQSLERSENYEIGARHGNVQDMGKHLD